MTVVLELAWDNPLVTVIVVAAVIWGGLLLLQQYVLLSNQEAQEDAGTAAVDELVQEADNNRFFAPQQSKPSPSAAPPASESESDGKLNDADGRLVQQLLEMAATLGAGGDPLNQANLEVSWQTDPNMVTQAYTNWVLTPGGRPGVHSLLLIWARAKFAEDGGASHQPEKPPVGSAARFGFGKRAKAAWEDLALWSSRLLEAVEGDAAHWGRQRIAGRFYFVSEGPQGQAHLVQHKGDKYTCYEVLGLGKSVGDALRAAGGTPPALLTLTLLPFMGRLISDGQMQLEEHRGGKGLEKRLQEAVRDATEAGTLVRSLDLPPRSEGGAAAEKAKAKPNKAKPKSA